MTINETLDLSTIAKVNKPKRFHLPFDQQTIQDALTKAYQAEVYQRGGTAVQCNEAIIKDMARWLTDPDGKPGLLLYGSVGTGKTTALYALRRVINAACQAERDDNTLLGYGKSVIEIVKAKEIVESYTQVPMHYSNMKRVDLLAIDELGVENVDVKNYGNASEPIIDLLSHRYDKMKVTAISSNLTMKQIEERYGLRLADRFNEMFHKIAFTGKSFRR